MLHAEYRGPNMRIIAVQTPYIRSADVGESGSQNGLAPDSRAPSLPPAQEMALKDYREKFDILSL